MSVTAVLYLLAGALYTGFQWTIRVLVYPQFARVPAAGFAPYERNHQRLVSFAVGPLFAGLGLASVAVAARPPAGTPMALRVAAPALYAAILATTALAAVPQHRRLSEGFDPVAHRRLLAADSVRLVLAAASTAVALTVLMR